jgi:hypothetical protein
MPLAGVWGGRTRRASVDLEYFKRLEARMVALLSAFQGSLLPRCFDDAMAYVVQHGEYGLAFEDLCACLGEDEAWSTGTAPRLSAEQYRELEALGKMMEIDESWWIRLKPAS